MRQSIESVFSVYDNTSATSAKIIGYNKGKKNLVNLGDIALVVPKKFIITKEIQKKKKYIGLVIGIRRKIKRGNGCAITSFDNKVLLFSLQYKFLGTRVYGGFCKEARGGFRESLFKKAIGYSSGAF